MGLITTGVTEQFKIGDEVIHNDHKSIYKINNIKYDLIYLNKINNNDPDNIIDVDASKIKLQQIKTGGKRKSRRKRRHHRKTKRSRKH